MCRTRKKSVYEYGTEDASPAPTSFPFFFGAGVFPPRDRPLPLSGTVSSRHHDELQQRHLLGREQLQRFEGLGSLSSC